MLIRVRLQVAPFEGIVDRVTIAPIVIVIVIASMLMLCENLEIRWLVAGWNQGV